MPKLLLQRIAPDSVQEFSLAALARHKDALALVGGEQRLGAVYLFGYVAEMLLKAAYFRHLGFGDTQPIKKADLEAAVGKKGASQAQQLQTPTTSNYHDLPCWTALLIAYRKHLSVPYAPDFESALSGSVAAISSTWREWLRYHKNQAFASEVARIQRSCVWLVDHRNEL